MLERHSVDQLFGLIGGIIGRDGCWFLISRTVFANFGVEVVITLEIVDILHLEGVAGSVYLWDCRCEKFFLKLHAQVMLGSFPLSLFVENDPLNHFLFDFLLDA